MNPSQEIPPSPRRPLGGTHASEIELPEIRLINLSKRFESLWANREINLEVHRGEIHAIVGENGAGKTTLMKVLCGHFRPDGGVITFNGVETRFSSPRQAGEAGLGMVSQQPSTFPQLTALENICVGHPPGLLRCLKPKKARVRLEALCGLFGFEIPLDRLAGELAYAHRQQIELLRVLYRGARVLVLDEPTSLLAPPEVENLLELLRTLRARQHTILFVSHRLAEVRRLADRVSILTKGRCVGSFEIGQVTQEFVANLIVRGGQGHADTHDGLEKGPVAGAGPFRGDRRVVLRVSGVRTEVSAAEEALDRVSLEISAGESLGIGGVVGNGQRLFARTLAGMAAPIEGTIQLAGEDAMRLSPGDRRSRGLHWLPADLAGEGLLPGGSVLENCLLGSQRDARFHWHRWLRLETATRWAASVLRAGEVRYDSLRLPVSTLSGGNLQKLAIARVLEGRPTLVVLEQPMRGLDLRGQERLRQRLSVLQEQGVAFLVISHDLDELFALCDRVGVLFRGALMGVQSSAEARRETLVRWMLGAET